MLGFFLAMLLVRFLRLCNRYLVHIVYIIIVFVCIYIYILYSGFSWVSCYYGFDFIWDFPRPGVCLCLLGFVFGSLLQFSPGRGSVCVFWFLFVFCFLQFFPGQGTACISFAYGPLYAYVVLCLMLC